MEQAEPEAEPGIADLYAQQGYILQPGLIDPGFCTYLTRYLLLCAETGRAEADGAVANAFSMYGDPAFDTLLNVLAFDVSAHVGHEVVPTYSFARLYSEGSELVKHVDRPACEHSISLHLGGTATAWALRLLDHHESEVSVMQEPGDALAYQGMQLVHWRDRLDVGWQAQLFLHWVEVGGTYASQRFDGRSSLGLPPILRP